MSSTNTADPGRSGREGTGWHSDMFGEDVHRADPDCDGEPCKPVLVIPAAGARDTIARALGEFRGDPMGPGTWDEQAAEAVLAALVREAGR